jgi:hypothetical protein
MGWLSVIGGSWEMDSLSAETTSPVTQLVN